MKAKTLGSLFDGSGGFPVGGLLAGITPLWASEIEPFAIRVTTKRLPQMQHFGDVTKLDGAKLPPVDIITFGSPCQDMSVAGRRAGLGGNKSCLFYEAIRIIKEMRQATNGEKPRYAVWENVLGAFSSNGGEDFRAVLQSFCEASIPRFKGRWPHAGEIMADGYSLAWRVLDAQYWGVPQRRRRIFLVMDFNGQRAREILFKPEAMPTYPLQARASRTGNTESITDCFGIQGTIIGRREKNGSQGSGINVDKMYTLTATDRHAVAYGLDNSAYQGGIGSKYAIATCEEKAPTMMAHGPGVVATQSVVRRLLPSECARLQGFPDWWCSDLATPNPTEEEIAWWMDILKPKTRKQVIRWLKNPYSESAEYKMWGNGVALPCVYYVLQNIVAEGG